MLRICAALAALLLCAAAAADPVQRRGLVVRQVDHLLVESSDPAALFSFLTGTLQLPAAWPVSENQGYVTAGVSVGNINLEMFRYADRNKPSARPEARYSGLTFEPYPLEGALRELQLRGIRYLEPQRHVSALPNGSTGVAWTTVALPDLSSPRMSINLYEYSPAFLKVEIRRKQLGNRLTLNNGGPLRVLSAAQIMISSPDPAKDGETWTRLLGKQQRPGVWRPVSGPEIRIEQGREKEIRELALKVGSLAEAAAFLSKAGLLGSASAGSVQIKTSNLQGLRIRLKS